MQRRMGLLFLVAMALLCWQASHSSPLIPPAYVSVVEAGEQVFPIAVPNWEAPPVPADPALRLTFLRQHAVRWPERTTTTACDLFVRVSLHHWAHLAVDRARLTSLQGDPTPALPGPRTLHWASEGFLDDDDRDGDPLDAGELLTTGTGAEVEVFCRP